MKNFRHKIQAEIFGKQPFGHKSHLTTGQPDDFVTMTLRSLTLGLCFATLCHAQMPPIPIDEVNTIYCDGDSVINECGHGKCKPTSYDSSGDLVYTCECSSEYASMDVSDPCSVKRKNQGLMFGLAWLPVPSMSAFLMGWNSLAALELVFFPGLMIFACCCMIPAAMAKDGEGLTGCMSCLLCSSIVGWIIIHFTVMGLIGTDCVDGDGVECLTYF